MSEQKEQNAKQNEQENSSQKQDELNFSEQDFEDFVRRFSDYLANANESKKRGNNDYNPLKAVQSPHDEVNMHSGFLVSLLNTRGEHYQDDLFLRLFLQALGLAEWFGSTKNAQVFKETQKIDIHIFNSENHIIIENKIWADDQDKQIASYIEAIKQENVKYKNIAVVYLSPFGREPSQNSLDKWQIKGDLLEFEKETIKYKQISYEKDILKWIESCQKEVGNITNLNSALEFYKDIVEIITNQKESKMSIAEFFEKETDFEVAFEICKNEDEIMWAYLKSIVADESFCKKIKDKIGNNWEVKYDEEVNIIRICDTNYGNDICCCIGIEWYKCHFEYYLIFDGEYEIKKHQSGIEKALKDLNIELFTTNGCIFVDKGKIIENPINIKDEILAWLDKELIELTNQINEKLKNFKIKG